MRVMRIIISIVQEIVILTSVIGDNVGVFSKRGAIIGTTSVSGTQRCGDRIFDGRVIIDRRSNV
jgi:hypothetical protein